MIVGVIVGVIVRRGAECRMIKTKTKKTASAYSPTIKPLKTVYRSQWQGRYSPDTDFCYPLAGCDPKQTGCDPIKFTLALIKPRLAVVSLTRGRFLKSIRIDSGNVT